MSVRHSIGYVEEKEWLLQQSGFRLQPSLKLFLQRTVLECLWPKVWSFSPSVHKTGCGAHATDQVPAPEHLDPYGSPVPPALLPFGHGLVG